MAVNKLIGSTLTSGSVSHFESKFNFNVKNDQIFYTNMLLREYGNMWLIWNEFNEDKMFQITH